MELTKEHIGIGAACLIAGILLGAGLHSCGRSSKPSPAVVVHDTLTVRDTVRIQGKTRTLYVTRHDTMYIQKPVSPDYIKDSLCNGHVTDSIPVSIPITQYNYRDTFQTDSSRIELGVLFSGYNAQINGIELKSQYTVQPRTVEKKRGWGQFVGIGIGVGYGASVVNNRVYAAPEIGVHVTYGWGYTWRK